MSSFPPARILPLLASAAIAFGGSAQESADDGPVFTLGAFEVRGDGYAPLEARAESVDAATLESMERRALSSALDLLPGVTLNSVAGRNEVGVYARGFDLRQVPLFIDGIPIYVPYDGYVDLGRFTTFDVAEISVAKGFSSVIAGPNALGGAINVVSRRPQKPLEASLMAGVFSGGGRTFSASLGAKSDRWYGLIDASRVSQDYYRLSDDYRPASPTEDGGRRENSFREDQKISAKLGFTPNASDEYAIGFARQEGEKGAPPYAGIDPATRPRYWRWPQWDKTSVYFIGSTRLGAESYLKPRLYYDTFQNQLFAYDDDTYTTQNRPSSFRSLYDDYTFGGSLEFGTTAFAGQTLKLAAHYKDDVHREHNVGDPETRFRDRTWSLAAEDVWRASEKLSVVGGVSFEGRESVEAQNLVGSSLEDFPGNRNRAANPQLGLFYALDPSSTLELSVARKSRFPTVKDRYSYRLGQAIPNPDLRAERALHYEAAYRSQPTERLGLRASLFLSRIDDAIQRVDRVATTSEGDPLFQLRNVGEAEHRGFELGFDHEFSERLRWGGHYTHLKRENKTHPEIRLTDTPKGSLFLFAEAKPFQSLRLVASFERDSSRFYRSDGATVSGFELVDLKAIWELPAGCEASFGVSNLLDEDYQLAEGYPEEGRSFFANFAYRY